MALAGRRQRSTEHDAAEDDRKEHDRLIQERGPRQTALDILVHHRDPQAVEIYWPNLQIRLQRANLTEATLHNANLTGANLNEADLAGANLNGANLTDANLNNTQRKAARQASQPRAIGPLRRRRDLNPPVP